MKRWITLGMLALAALLSTGVAQANHSWGSYHWARTSNPFTLQLVDSVANGWNAHLTTASSDWSVATVLDTRITSGGDDSTTRKRCKPVSGKVHVCNAPYGFNGWLGIAQIWPSGSHITKAVVKNNDSYLDNPGFITPYETAEWRQMVICQEVGHALGLDHQDENFDNPNLGTCMDYTSDPSTNQHPDAHDYAQLATIYGHTDSNNTYTQPTKFAAPEASADHGEQEDLGTPTGKKDGKGRDILFVKDLGAGQKRFTWVIWADWSPSNGK